ncbi:class F sortase [Nocardioides halotolerans]|uniref:class F sortase n=1 Tax=Nocardioides halotolerans TaxID=433660 RepID=UPI0003FF1952|nr:class F sortase [Nocardioides halotolerans]
MSSIATSAGPAPFQRFATGFGRFSAVLSAFGLLVAVALSVPGSWFELGDRGRDAAGQSTYTDLTPAEPVRLAVAGLSGVELVAPLVSTAVEPRQLLETPPDDAPLVGWWDGSAKAGAPHGQTILVAHAGADGGGLTQIADLGKGDFVELLTKEGTMRYEVSSVRTFDPARLERVGVQLFKQDGGAGRLVMLSAEAWDGATYQRSVVAVATPLGQPTVP